MNFRFLCTCGYTLISYDPTLREVVCPDCKIQLTPDENPHADESDSQKKHGLWQLISETKTESNESLVKESQNRQIHNTIPPIEKTESKPSPYKSLWETMRSEPEKPPEPSSTEIQSATEIAVKPEPVPAQSTPTTPMPQPVADEDGADQDDIVKLDKDPTPETEPFHRSADSLIEKPAPRSAIVGSIVGTIAIFVSPVGMFDEFIYKFPGTAIAFVGLIFSLQAWNDLARSRGRRRGMGLASYGVFCGVVGMILGPTLFSWLGNRLRDETGLYETENHIAKVGSALDEFHDQNRHFPIGGTYKDLDGQARTPMHGWMTSLLPFMENREQQIYKNIDFNLPYDHAKNRKAMGTDIPDFFAAGSSREKLNGTFAITHFSGVGSMYDSNGVNMGIFHRDVAVSRSDIKDGLSNTLIVGEIAHFFPAWGSPDNRRTVRDGLNKDRMGFGNAAGTGATFLHADGSVKFYSNATNTKQLQRLSTRNGRE